MEHIERTHPLRVTLGQIVVHRHHVYTVTREGIQEYRQGSHERLTLTSGHLGDFSLMQYDTTEQLHVVVDHLPFQVVTACSPVVMIDGLVTVDGDEVLLRVTSQLTVEVCGRHDGLLVLGKAAGGLFHDGKHFWHHLVEGFLVDVEHFLLDLVDLCEDVCTLVDGGALDGGLQFVDAGFLLLGSVLHLLLNGLGALAQCIVVQFLNLW